MIRSLFSLLKGLCKRRYDPPKDETFDEFLDNESDTGIRKLKINKDEGSLLYLGYKLYFSDAASATNYCADAIEEVSVEEIKDLELLGVWMRKKREQVNDRFNEDVYYLTGGCSVSQSYISVEKCVNIMNRDFLSLHSMTSQDDTAISMPFVYVDCDEFTK